VTRRPQKYWVHLRTALCCFNNLKKYAAAAAIDVAR
jgi:hypothetical protein